jgi:protein-disulfide isomerase
MMKMRILLDALGGAMLAPLLACALGLAATHLHAQAPGAAAKGTQDRPGGLEVPASRRVNIAGAPMLGRANAPVTIVEFSEFECPACQRFSVGFLPRLKKEFIDTGKVRFVFLDLPIEKAHPQSRKAAEAAQCAAEQGKFWEMHDLLYAQKGKLNVSQYGDFAGKLGLKRPEFDACFKSGKHASKIDRSRASASAIGISLAPSFIFAKSERGNIVNEGMIADGLESYDQFRELIEQVLLKK